MRIPAGMHDGTEDCLGVAMHACAQRNVETSRRYRLAQDRRLRISPCSRIHAFHAPSASRGDNERRTINPVLHHDSRAEHSHAFLCRQPKMQK
jgi:hypothetical protein